MSKTANRMNQGLLSSALGEFTAYVIAVEEGVVAGLEFIDPDNNSFALKSIKKLVSNGAKVEAGSRLVEVVGTASQLAIAEDYILGPLGYASGLATRAASFKEACPPGLSIACGGWKKLPVALKPIIRSGLASVGVLPRLVDGDFVYVGKNSVTMLGGVKNAIDAGLALNHGPVSVQVKSVEEASYALEHGAGVIMVDTGDLDDLRDVAQLLRSAKGAESTKLAFGGGVKKADLHEVGAIGAQFVDVGRAILDAPLLDLRLSVTDR